VPYITAGRVVAGTDEVAQHNTITFLVGITPNGAIIVLPEDEQAIWLLRSGGTQ